MFQILEKYGREGARVCVCVSVCPRSANAIKRLYSILNLPMGFLLSVEDFQLTDLSKRPSFRRYSLFRSF